MPGDAVTTLVFHHIKANISGMYRVTPFKRTTPFRFAERSRQENVFVAYSYDGNVRCDACSWSVNQKSVACPAHSLYAATDGVRCNFAICLRKTTTIEPSIAIFVNSRRFLVGEEGRRSGGVNSVLPFCRQGHLNRRSLDCLGVT